MNSGWWVKIFLLLLILSCGEGRIEFDKFGGLKGHRGSNESGFFRVEKVGNRWWLITPENNLFISFGANSVNFNGDYVPRLGYSLFRNNLIAKFGGEDFRKWRDEVRGRFEILKFNTLGSWSDDGITVFADTIPYTLNLSFARRAVSKGVPVASRGWWTGFPDVFDPSFEVISDEIARESIEESLIPPFPYPETDSVGYGNWKRKDDPYLIGYFLENELNWFGDSSFWEMRAYTLTDDFISLPPNYAGKRAWVEFLKGKYTLPQLNGAYGTNFSSWEEILSLTALPDDPSHPSIRNDKLEFLEEISERFFRITTEAVKRYDPNHLILCARFASDVPEEVLRSASRHCDVISINDYYTTRNLISDSLFGEAEERWKRFYSITKEEVGGRPFMLTEFGIRAWDSGNPNSWGAGWWVDYQEERANYFEMTVRKLLMFESEGEYFVLGFHWFEWEDEPKLGRFDGENSNYGLNSIKDGDYITLQREIGRSIEEFYRNLLGYEKKEVKSPSIHISDGENGVTIKLDGRGVYELVLSTARSFEGSESIIISGEGEEITLPLSSGVWWITGRRNEGGVWSKFSTPHSFTVNEKCGDFSSPSSWRNYRPYLIPDFSQGIAVILPIYEISQISNREFAFPLPSTQFLLLAVFTVNSYRSVNFPFADGEVLSLKAELCSEIFVDELRFEVFPYSTFNGKGEFVPSTNYMGIALYNENGEKVYDTGIPLSPSMKVIEWNSLILPVSARVKVMELYVDTSNPHLPLDQNLYLGLRFSTKE